VGKATFLRDTLSELVPETDLFVADTKIDSAREAVEFCKTHPLAGSNRYVIVDDAHRLMESAQDAYLKLLEEPGSHSCVVFVVPDEGLLQPAIVSRFRSTIRWKLLTLGEMRNFAIAFGSGEDSKALMLCNGRPGLFHAMFEDEGGTKHAELHETIMRAFTGDNILLESTPEVVKEAKEPIQRECVAHICRAAALTVHKFKKPSPEKVAALLRYSAVLLSVPSASAELHWLRMATHLVSLV
jgi:DNA polymerase III delta prime subunit